jgi:hypothetical protein
MIHVLMLNVQGKEMKTVSIVLFAGIVGCLSGQPIPA